VYRWKTYKRNSAIWRTVFDLAQKKNKIIALEKESEKPEFWSDPETSGKLSKELVLLKEEIEEFELLQKEFADVKELGEEFPEELASLQKRIEKQEIRTFLSGKYDRANAILTITAGAGGQDAQDWASLLQRMYERYCQRKGWRTQIIEESPGQISMEIIGPYAYGLLSRETGVHRLVRISPFSAKRLRHTSFAAVEALPQIDLKDEKEIDIKPDDLRIDLFRASGPGGQNVNKRETAVRITHIPTGIIVSSQAARTQQHNKEKALQVLASKLYRLQEQERKKELGKLKGKQSAIEWGSQIRSYVLHPYQMVKDVRTQVETGDTEGVLDGDLDAFIEAALRLRPA